MAIVCTNKLVNGSPTDATSYATASFTPSANTLYLATFITRNNITANPTQPTCTGAGLTWVVVASVVHDDTSASRKRVTLFRALGAAPSAGALTFDEAGQTQTSADWAIDELTGTDTSGTNGSGAIVQSVTALEDTGTATTLTATLGAFSSVNNATYGAIAIGGGGGTFTPGSGFTKIADFADSEAGNEVVTQFRSTNSTSVGFTSSVSGELGIIAVELAVPIVGAATYAPTMTMMGI